MNGTTQPAADAAIGFRCNICGRDASARLAALTREEPNCRHCRSTVRTRAIVHLLTTGLFGRSMAIDEIPPSPEIAGIGLSDWHEYAWRLAKKFGYVNTFYHKAPKLDITATGPGDERRCDFLISTEVFEHVAPPASRAFANAWRLLKPGGLLVLTVPFQIDCATIEHFPNLHRYEIVSEKGRRILRNTTAEGKLEVFEDLCFHGGDGSTLEMRIFSESGLIEELERAGFEAIRIHREDELRFGIHWACPWSLPISARRPEA
jgi:hypothetical protein